MAPFLPSKCHISNVLSASASNLYDFLFDALTRNDSFDGKNRHGAHFQSRKDDNFENLTILIFPGENQHGARFQFPKDDNFENLTISNFSSNGSYFTIFTTWLYSSRPLASSTACKCSSFHHRLQIQSATFTIRATVSGLRIKQELFHDKKGLGDRVGWSKSCSLLLISLCVFFPLPKRISIIWERRAWTDTKEYP